MSSAHCDDIWDESPSSTSNSTTSALASWTGYSNDNNRSSDSSNWRSHQGNRRTDSRGRGRGRTSYNSDRYSSRNGENNGPRRPKNDYWQHDNRSDTRQGKNFYQDDGCDRIQSCEFTNSSRQFSARDPKNRYGDRKSVNDLQNDFATLTIRSSDVGKIIGKGGSKIRELQDESGARINVQHNDNQPETTVELRGSEDDKKKAKELIEEFLANFTDKSRSNGSRNWGSNNDSTKLSGSKDVSTSDESSFEPIDWQGLLHRSDMEREKRLASLPPVKKNFYFESPEVSNMSTKEVAEFRQRNNSMTVSKLNEDDQRKIPKPVTTFEQAFLHYPEILEEIRKQNFKEPSPIQCQAWPILLQGHDMIGIAQTGTGKTIAFLLPAMIHIDNQAIPRAERPGPTCLILAPTRELAQQIEQETKKYQYRAIKCVCLYGGGNRRDQINVVTKGVEIVIATPGRLNDLVMNNIVDVTGVTYLVLDEADRMLDMGFEPQIKKILLDIRPDRQTVMTSATWPAGVRRLADRYMDKPFQVCIGTLDLTAVHSVTQCIVMTSDEEKREILYDFLQSMGPQDKVIVFVDKKSVCDDISSDLVLDGIECQSLHGDREQCDREQALDDLKTGRARILIATDVASRGLDVKDITHIFNYNFPRNIEEYVHRVGRTGRAGRTGESITLFTRNDWRHAEELIKILQEANQDVPDELYDMAERYVSWKQRKEAEEAACGGRFRSGRRGRGRRD